jgi:hypothetical protein
LFMCMQYNHKGNSSIAPHISNLNTRFTWMISFMSQTSLPDVPTYYEAACASETVLLFWSRK